MSKPLLPDALDDAVERSASPAATRLTALGLVEAYPELSRRLADPDLAAAVAAVVGASRAFATQLLADPRSVEVLEQLDEPVPVTAASPTALKTSKDRELLRIAARDLLGIDRLEESVAAVSRLAADVVAGALELSGPGPDLAVIGMGKLGGNELNYASDIDVMFVGAGDPDALERRARDVLRWARPCFRVDANLRPQGRAGSLVRTVESYEAYWARWAEPWEFQALLKARFVAGDEALGKAFEETAGRHLWSRTFTADDLRSLRHLKARAEAELARKGLTDREVKRGRGGIRDIEFAVQLLQLVHGRLDPALRTPTTLEALREMGAAGYVDPTDAEALADAYRFLRALEHRLQLWDLEQVYEMPLDEPARDRIARTMAFRDTGTTSALEQLDIELARHQATVRSIHERVYFRPLLEVFAGTDGQLARPGALEARLTAFGFRDAMRTRAAVRELTRGLTRSSRLMQQLLPLLLGWLSEAPDPDLGLLALRNLVGTPQRAEEVTRVFRDSPEAARRLCHIAGTSRLAVEVLQRDLDLLARLPYRDRLLTQPRPVLVEKARSALSWREGTAEQQVGLQRWKERHLFGVIARDILGDADVVQVGADLSAIADATVQVAVEVMEPKVPFAVIAVGRHGGQELSYASDLDVLFVYDGASFADQEEAERVGMALRRFLDGDTPAQRIWDVDIDLRPEGKQGPVARSLEGYARYFDQWAQVWERQAMSRARTVAGDEDVGRRFCELLDDFVWGRPLSDDEAREIRRMKARIERERIPAGEDPQFHLKLGRGSLSDVEWTAQLLQLRYGVRATGTVEALDALLQADRLSPDDHRILRDAYRFCEATRNRLFLVQSAPGNALPQRSEELRWLARSLDTTPQRLREDYRRVTRRCRAVMERLFYERDALSPG